MPLVSVVAIYGVVLVVLVKYYNQCVIKEYQSTKSYQSEESEESSKGSSGSGKGEDNNSTATTSDSAADFSKR
jgi:hypothetical protein